MTTNAHAASHYLQYEVLATLPARIMQAQGSEQSNKKKANLVHDAVLFLLFVLMPLLRPKQVCKARIDGAANVFKGPVDPRDAVTAPAWIADELHRDPTAQFWQMRFSSKETLAGRELHAYVPHELTSLLEDYLANYRPLLVNPNNDPGTLFLSRRGGPLRLSQLIGVIGDLSERFTGRRIGPAGIRLAFALCWLHENHNDYCTLSRALGHADVRTTMRMFRPETYLSVSQALRKVEEWAHNRKSKTEDEHKK